MLGYTWIYEVKFQFVFYTQKFFGFQIVNIIINCVWIGDLAGNPWRDGNANSDSDMGHSSDRLE